MRQEGETQKGRTGAKPENTIAHFEQPRSNEPFIADTIRIPYRDLSRTQWRRDESRTCWPRLAPTFSQSNRLYRALT